MKAICGSVNFDLFLGHPSSSGPNHTSAKLEFSSKDRSRNREAGQIGMSRA
jgi:hypothetical protein